MYYEIEFQINKYILFRQKFVSDGVVYQTEILTRNDEQSPFTHFLDYTPSIMKDNPYLIDEIIKNFKG